LFFKSYQKSSSLLLFLYPDNDIIFPNENKIANLAGLPAATLNNDPKDKNCMMYPKD